MGTGRQVGHLWHMYQPPWQTSHWTNLITDESYGWLSQWLSQQDPARFKVNVNINASLTEQLVREGRHEVIDNLALAAQRGVVEFVDSAAYHPVLPCLPRQIRSDTIRRQAEKNRSINGQYFGKDIWQCKGFFPPEMAFSPDVAAILKAEGYAYTITEDTVFEHGSDGGSIPHDTVATVAGLPVFFRSGDWSRKFAMEYPTHVPRDDDLLRRPVKERSQISTGLASRFAKELSQGLENWFDDGYAVLAYDWETIGHHQKVYNAEALDAYVQTLHEHGTRPAHLSSLLQQYGKGSDLESSLRRPLCGSWSTSATDAQAGEYFPLWQHSQNPLHRAYWNLVVETAKLLPQHLQTQQEHQAYELFDKALNSCPLWWANPLNDKWEPQFVRTGASLLRETGASMGAAAEPQYQEVLKYAA